MLDLWGILGQMVHDPTLITDINTVVNGRISETKRHVKRGVVSDVRDHLAPKSWSPYLTSYAAGEAARWSSKSVFGSLLSSIKSTQEGLTSWGSLNPATLPPEFYQTLGLTIIDPQSRIAVANGVFPNFAGQLSADMKTNLTQLANDSTFQGTSDTYIAAFWEEVVCFGRAEFYNDYSHPDQ